MMLLQAVESCSMEVADLLEECIDTLATATAQWDRWRCTTVYVTTTSQAGRQAVAALQPCPTDPPVCLCLPPGLQPTARGLSAQQVGVQPAAAPASDRGEEEEEPDGLSSALSHCPYQRAAPKA